MTNRFLCNLQTTVGNVKYAPEQNIVVWSIKSFPVSGTVLKSQISSVNPNRLPSFSSQHKMWCLLGMCPVPLAVNRPLWSPSSLPLPHTPSLPQAITYAIMSNHKEKYRAYKISFLIHGDHESKYPLMTFLGKYRILPEKHQQTNSFPIRLA